MNGPAPIAHAAADRRRWTIRAQLVALVLAVAVPAAGLVAYALVAAANEARNAAYAQVQQLATAAANRLDFVLRDSATMLVQLSRRPGIRALDPRHCDPLIKDLVAVSSYYTTLAVRDRHGAPVCSYLPNPLGSDPVARFPWFVEGMRSETLVVGDAFPGLQSRRWVSVLTHPVRDEAGRVEGLLALPLDLRALHDRLFAGLPEGTLVSVLDRRNVFLMRSVDPDRWIGQPLPGPQAARVGGRRAGETFETTGVDGIARMYATAAVPNTGWRVFAALPTDVVLAPHRERLVRSAGFGFAALLAVIALSYGIGASIARPIGELARTAAALRASAGQEAPPTEGAAEVATVASELSRLAAERAHHRGEREALVAHYEHLLKSTRDIYLLVDASGRIADFNDAALQAYGLPPEEFRGKSIIELRASGERATVERDWKEIDRAGGGLFETVHERRDGSQFDVEVSASPVVIDGVFYRQAFVRNITARKTAEAMLRRQNAELDRFNRAVVGRELDMIELKQRINELSRELGRAPTYPLAFLEPGEDVARGPRT